MDSYVIFAEMSSFPPILKIHSKYTKIFKEVEEIRLKEYLIEL